MKSEKVKSFGFVEWLRTSIGGRDYDYLMFRSFDGSLFFLLKNESESRLIKVTKKRQVENDDITLLIRKGEEIVMPFCIDLERNHKVCFDNGFVIVE